MAVRGKSDELPDLGWLVINSKSLEKDLDLGKIDQYDTQQITDGFE